MTTDWDRYDTRSVVYRPTHLTPEQLEDGYWRAYRDFYTWRNIAKGAATKPNLRSAVLHAAYSGGWKRFESMWDAAIRAKRIAALRPVLEGVLRAPRQRTAPRPVIALATSPSSAA